MIIAVEGPDRCGKTTLFELLRNKSSVVAVPSVPFSRRLLPVVDLLEERTLALWAALYDPSKTYLCDRCPFVSNRVYGELYGRERKLSYLPWDKELRVLYIAAPLDVLLKRPKDPEFDPRYEEVLSIYERLLPTWPHYRVLATNTLEYQVESAKYAIDRWINDGF